MMIPRLHIITDDGVLARTGFTAEAEQLLQAGGADVALHVRGHHTAGAVLYAHATRLAAAARRSGSILLVNDRIDIAMGAGAHGVQLGAASLPVREARALIGADALIGFSAHAPAPAAYAVVDGADFVLMGTIFASASHPGREPAGVESLRECAARAGAAVIGIGGITPARVAAAAHAGAHGVAVLGGVWHAQSPAEAVTVYLDAIRRAYTAGQGQEQSA